MKRLVLLVGFATLVAHPALAQRSQSIEFGGFGSYWRFDHLYFLKNSVGGGARIAYAWSDRLSLEVTADFTKTVEMPLREDGSLAATAALYSVSGTDNTLAEARLSTGSDTMQLHPLRRARDSSARISRN